MCRPGALPGGIRSDLAAVTAQPRCDLAAGGFTNRTVEHGWKKSNPDSDGWIAKGTRVAAWREHSLAWVEQAVRTPNRDAALAGMESEGTVLICPEVHTCRH
jgi:hypothetical protein